mgnify:FL=1
MKQNKDIKITTISKQIPIVFSFDDNYTIPAAVAFYSLLNKAVKNVFYKMFVLHADISEENQNLLQSIINKTNNATLSFIDTKGFLANEWERGNFSKNAGQFTTDTIIRCFVAKFLPQYDKAIYSDVDVVVVDDISKLFDIDLKDKYMGVVRGAFNNYSESELSHLSEENYEKFKDTYFAGGIWLLNLKKIREDNLESKMIEIILDNSIIKRWNDQDIMNIACDNKVEFIPLNYISYPYLHSYLKKPNFTSHYTRDELYDSIISPKIIHYADVKPWASRDCFLAQIWWQIFDYLQLPKTSIFKNIKTQESDENIRLRKRYKKYKRLFNIFLVTSILYTIIFIISFY